MEGSGESIRRHIRNNVVGYVAVFLALSGGAYALEGRNTIDSGDIKRGQVGRSDLAANAVNSPKVAPDSLTGSDIAEGTLTQVPSALSAGSADSANTLDGIDSTGFLPSNGTAVDADRLDGVDSTGYLRYGSPIPSGVTITGAVGGITKDTGTASTGALLDQVVTFPVPAPADLAGNQVNFAPDGTGTGVSFAADDDATCTGSSSAPAAPPGKVCIYVSFLQPGFVLDSATGSSLGGGGLGRLGFEVIVPDTAGGGAKKGFIGSWAYTAP